MRLQVSIAALAFLCAGLGAQAPPASAPASSASGKIGIVNVQTAIQNCQEGKKAVADLNSQFGPKQSDLQNQSKQIQQLQKQLQDGGNMLSADAKAELTRTITSKQKDLQRAYDLHANCYIAKPVDLDEFLNVVRSIEQFWFNVVSLPSV